MKTVVSYAIVDTHDENFIYASFKTKEEAETYLDETNRHYKKRGFTENVGYKIAKVTMEVL